MSIETIAECLRVCVDRNKIGTKAVGAERLRKLNELADQDERARVVRAAARVTTGSLSFEDALAELAASRS